ncbi:MAG: ABC transporter permease subunit [Rhizobiaceae bacterium]|nr:ABC transporter permease subunit [Rhizobiaceae bacterium]
MLTLSILRYSFSHLWALALLFLIWQAYVTIQDFNSIVLPSPTRVFGSIFFELDIYAAKTWKTLWVSILGLLLGSFIGAAFAILGWVSVVASGMVSISAIVVRSVPIVVFVPILAAMMGYTTTMVITLVALMSFFPSFVMVSSGLSSLPPAAHDVAQVYGATKLRKLLYIALPASLPNLLASIRLSASRAILATMVAEFLTGIDGLGTLFLLARADLDSEVALGAALVAAAAALALYYVADIIETSIVERLS